MNESDTGDVKVRQAALSGQETADARIELVYKFGNRAKRLLGRWQQRLQQLVRRWRWWRTPLQKCSTKIFVRQHVGGARVVLQANWSRFHGVPSVGVLISGFPSVRSVNHQNVLP
jgi:hypothetical protein